MSPLRILKRVVSVKSLNGSPWKMKSGARVSSASLESCASTARLVKTGLSGEKAGSTGPLDASRRTLDRAHRATFLLVTQIADAFVAAHGIDPKIPALTSMPAKPRRVEPMAPRRPLDAYAPREAHLVVLNVDESKRGTLLVPYAQPARMVVPAPMPRVLEAGDLGASGVIRKRSKPPTR